MTPNRWQPVPHGEYSPDDFTATALETSEGRLVHVTGSGMCPSPGWQVRLVTAGRGAAAHPGRLVLELRDVPTRRELRARTETTVDVTVEDTSAVEVEIRFGWREGFVLPVREPAIPRIGARRHQRTDAAAARFAASVG